MIVNTKKINFINVTEISKRRKMGTRENKNKKLFLTYFNHNEIHFINL